MQRFEPKNSFGWTFFVLIVASFWTNAAVKFDASPSSAPAVASRSTSDDSSTTFDSTAQTFESKNAAFSPDGGQSTTALFEAAPFGVRRVQDSSRRRIAGDDFSSAPGSARSPFSVRGCSSTFFRSFWACQAASRPLFLTLRSLRN
ncbi:MAG: hypothetical protein IIW01_05065 [Thermoguttaceae bacterium]|nr:hypothetical protein [Thermoguttaceae bacterium]